MVSVFERGVIKGSDEILELMHVDRQSKNNNLGKSFCQEMSTKTNKNHLNTLKIFFNILKNFFELLKFLIFKTALKKLQTIILLEKN